MTEHYAEIDLPRFCRHIGVTGLGGVDDGAGGRAPIGVVSPFAGVLETRVRDAGRRGPLPQLAYLTLAPLVTRDLAPTVESTAPSASGGDDRADATPTDDATEEPRVRDGIRERQQEREGDSTPSTGRDGMDGERGAPGSTLTTLERTVRDLRGDSQATESTTHDMPDRSEWRPDTGSTNAPLEGTVVDVAVHAPAETSVESAGPNEWSGSGQGAGTDAPTMTVVAARGTVPASRGDAGDGPVPARGSNAIRDAGTTPARSTRADSGGSSVVFDDAGADNRTSGDERRGPSLTVERAGSTESPDAATPTSTASSSTASRPDRAPSPQGSDQPEVRTVLERDGSVNERVLDRLYEELTRRQRLDRSREGR